ncbi:putative disease resistance protein RGA3 [Prunus avium]|uniref:Disease resistance protein RGA3 n=1 Tax=Prunus avium TaxID=42229 RepID=A0A6P5TVI7_PRUAV|nr:putative disease resistance protein RGA3 [Prunus avium]
MVDALISVLLERLASTTYEYIEGELKHVLNVKEDVEKFTRTLRVIQSMLEDAEQRQVTDQAVKIWLDELKDISYQMVDVLDEWNTDILRQQVEKQEREGDPNALVTKKKVRFSSFSRCFCFGKVSRVILRRDIALKIKYLNDKLTEIYEERKKYHFLRKELGIIQQPQQPQRPQTASYVNMSEIFGREKEQNILITKLLGDSSEEDKGLLLIPIVGMGGMGKTTLTQLAYNDDRVKSHFDMRKWVCVSDPFDGIKIAKAISGDYAPSSNELDEVLQCMSRSIQAKRFLLVLDDVWTDDPKKWEKLKVPLIQSGAKGSRILVTTRKLEVANMMRATRNMINLGGLSDEYCLSIFNHMAFSDRDVQEFGDISKEIVKKCKGLPLAAKTLGSLMLNKRTMREWKEVLKSKIWDLEKVEQEVFQPLFLSYYDLSPTIKSCLLYCATFPKDYEFQRDDLINLWMAQDYIISKGNKEKGTTGDAVFNNLVARSFFQDFEKDFETGTITSCKMHDIVHDFVQFLTKNECLIMDHAEGATSESKVLDDKVRHLTLRYVPKGPLPLSISSYNCKNLRTLATFDSKITTMDPNLILQLKSLRTLNLSGNSIKELPEEIGELIHLRHIDLSHNSDLEKLPDTICGLYNLSTLSLRFCYKLKKLPENMGNLINLKHLYVLGGGLESLPKGIRRLTSLQTLDVCRCGGDNDEAFQIGDLRKLNLEGILRIQLVGDATDKSEVEKAQLWDKKLFHLAVDFERQPNSSSSVEILNALRPHPDLESLTIRHHNGTTWPNWIQSLHNLRFLSVGWVAECELWPLGKLECLETLTLLRMEGVRKVGVEFLGLEYQTSFRIRSPPLILFPKLKQLSFLYMLKWEEWEGVEEWTKEDSDITIMPCLSKLTIYDCKLLKALPDFLFKTPLQTLRIPRSERLLERYQEGNGEWAKISATIPNIRIQRR